MRRHTITVGLRPHLQALRVHKGSHKTLGRLLRGDLSQIGRALPHTCRQLSLPRTPPLSPHHCLCLKYTRYYTSSCRYCQGDAYQTMKFAATNIRTSGQRPEVLIFALKIGKTAQRSVKMPALAPHVVSVGSSRVLDINRELLIVSKKSPGVVDPVDVDRVDNILRIKLCKVLRGVLDRDRLDV